NRYFSVSSTSTNVVGASGTGVFTVRDNAIGGTISLGSDGNAQTHVILGGNGRIDGQNSELEVAASSGFPLALGSNGSLHAYLTTAGRFGIGTSSPDATFSIVDGSFFLNASATKGLQTMTTDTSGWTNLGTDASNTPIAEMT